MNLRQHFVQKLTESLDTHSYVLITSVDMYAGDNSDMRIIQTLCRPYDIGSTDDQFIDLITKANWDRICQISSNIEGKMCDPEGYSYGMKISPNELSNKSLYEVCKYFGLL